MRIISIPPVGNCRLARRDAGTVLFFVLIMGMVLGLTIAVVMHLGQLTVRDARIHLTGQQALYKAWGDLAVARSLVGRSSYDEQGRNAMIHHALAQPDRMIPGTGVEVEALTGAEGTWFTLVARVPYEQEYERVVRQLVREWDTFASYNLFVSEHPAGVSGKPIGAIHSNDRIDFYFAGGEYRHSVTAVNGVDYVSGANVDNTTVLGPFDSATDRIELDTEGNPETSLQSIHANAIPEFTFADDVDVELELYVSDGAQWVRVQTYTQPNVEQVTEDVIVGYNEVNQREVEFTYTEQVSAGFETRTREIEVIDHYETQTRTEEVPVYVDGTCPRDVPVYRDETYDQEVAVYVDEERTRTVTQRVWVPLDSGDVGGTTVGGAGDVQTGYWDDIDVEETYTVRVFDHYETVTRTRSVIDHYDTVYDPCQVFDHNETVSIDEEVPIYRTETETYEEEVFETVERTDTRIEFDLEPILESQTRTQYNQPQLLSEQSLPAPENGLVYAGGNVTSVQGQVISPLTLATAGTLKITDDIVYVDSEGDTAYLNGKRPGSPYDPNPDYENDATLGLIAYENVLYGREVPENFELNASILAVTGRVGIEGVVLAEDGEIEEFNRLTDEFGRLDNGDYVKNSIRRLGGITTAERPVETVVNGGLVVSGFYVGRSVFDVGLLTAPPPYFLTYEQPRFFGFKIEK